MKQVKSIPIFFLFLLFGSIQAQEIPRIEVEAYKRIDRPARNEVSGIAKSRTYEDTFWVHGDSGTPDHIYAINEDGEIKSNDKDYKGAEVKGAKNLDWEDIALGENGTIILGDIGNNCECRDDMKIFILEEPNPKADEVEVLREYEIRYPKRDDWYGRLTRSNYNAEALFQENGVIYIITKQRRKASLFMLENPREDVENELVFIESFEIEHYVTAADISHDGNSLAVLTYDQVLVFELGNDLVFGNTFRTAYLEGVEQVESITFSGDNLIIAEEAGQLYRIGMDELALVEQD